MWPLGQAVKTPPSHGGIRGSIPLEATTETASEHQFVRIFLYLKILGN